MSVDVCFIGHPAYATTKCQIFMKVVIPLVIIL